MINQITGPLQPSAIYTTSFHLPNRCSILDLQDYMEKHATPERMPGLLTTGGPMIKIGESHIPDHYHVMIDYPFESMEKLKGYTDNKEVCGPNREDFQATYGTVAKENTRYVNGEELPRS